MGPNAKEAAPALLRIFADKEKWTGGFLRHDPDTVVGDALARIGKPVVAELIKTLQSSGQHKTYRVLAEIGSDAKEAVSVLIERLYDESDRTRELSAETLGMIGPEAKAAVPALIEALRDRDKDVRRAAAIALEGIGTNAMSIAALLEALQDPEAEVRQNAAAALGSFGPVARSAVQSLRKAIKDPEAEVRAAAALAMWRVQGDKGDVLLVFKELSKEKNAMARIRGAEGWWESSHDLEALRILVAALPSKDEGWRERAELLIDSTYWDEEDRCRVHAANALVRLGAQDKDLLVEIRKLLKDQRYSKKCLAGWVLARLDPRFAREVGLSTEELTEAFDKARRRSRYPAVERRSFGFGFVDCLSIRADRENLVDESDDINAWSGTILLPKRLRPKLPESPDPRVQDEPIGS
jgi:HEAT repeat protein